MTTNIFSVIKSLKPCESCSKNVSIVIIIKNYIGTQHYVLYASKPRTIDSIRTIFLLSHLIRYSNTVYHNINFT